MFKIQVDLNELRHLVKSEVQKAIDQLHRPTTWITFKQAQMMLLDANTRSSYHTLKKLIELGTIRQQGRKVCREDLYNYINNLT